MLHFFTFKRVKKLVPALSLFLIAACKPSMHSHVSTPKEADLLVDQLKDELNLDKAQEDSLQSILKVILEKQDDLDNMGNEIADNFLVQLKNDEFKEDQLNRLFEEKEKQFKEVRTLYVKKLGEAHAVLQPQQRVDLYNLLNEKKGNRKHRFHRKNH